MGNAQDGETAEVTINAKNENENGTYVLKVYALNQSIFERAYEKLADEQLQITEFSDTKIKGTVNALEDGIMFFSMPYEKGWSVYVDGEKAETMPVAQSMLGAKVPAGAHEITLKYVPEGFAAGTAASGISLALCGVTAFIDKKRRKNGVPENENAENSTAEMEDLADTNEKDETNAPKTAAGSEELTEETAQLPKKEENEKSES